jgi:hypothetical protein
MRKLFLIITVALLLFSCNESDKAAKPTDKKEVNIEQIEIEVWKAIEGRFMAWKESDFETYISFHHPQWKKWSSGKNHLSTKEEIASFWETMKSEEECLEMEITPIAIEILNDGKSAIAHYTHTETFTYTGEDMPDGRTKGNTFSGTLRWSDFMVKENEKWLVIGGHRDMSMPEGRLIQVNE